MNSNFDPIPLAPKLRDHARELRSNATDTERALWQRIRAKQLGVRFRRQHVIEPFVLDFYCVELKLAIELDGGQHNDECKRAADETRTAFLRSYGITVLRYWNSDVMTDIESVLTQLYSEIERLRSG